MPAQAGWTLRVGAAAAGAPAAGAAACAAGVLGQVAGLAGLVVRSQGARSSLRKRLLLKQSQRPAQQRRRADPPGGGVVGLGPPLALDIAGAALAGHPLQPHTCEGAAQGWGVGKGLPEMRCTAQRAHQAEHQ